MSTFGERLKFLRKDRKLTQPQLAKELGVSNGMISMWENNVCEPSLSHIKKTAKFFAVSADFLVGLED